MTYLVCDIPPYLASALSAVFGAFLSGCVGIYVARTLDRKRSASAVSALCFQLLSQLTPHTDCRIFHRDSLALLRPTIAALISLLKPVGRADLEKTWAIYQSLGASILDKGEWTEALKTFEQNMGRPYSTPEDTVRALLSDISTTATKYA
jgi:hypothetical protein